MGAVFTPDCIRGYSYSTAPRSSKPGISVKQVRMAHITCHNLFHYLIGLKQHFFFGFCGEVLPGFFRGFEIEMIVDDPGGDAAGAGAGEESDL